MLFTIPPFPAVGYLIVTSLKNQAGEFTLLSVLCRAAQKDYILAFLWNYSSGASNQIRLNILSVKPFSLQLRTFLVFTHWGHYWEEMSGLGQRFESHPHGTDCWDYEGQWVDQSQRIKESEKRVKGRTVSTACRGECDSPALSQCQTSGVWVLRKRRLRAKTGAVGWDGSSHLTEGRLFPRGCGRGKYDLRSPRGTVTINCCTKNGLD